MEPGPQGSACAVMALTKGADRVPDLGDLSRELGQILALELEERALGKLVHRERNLSNASRADATNEGAVLQWPRTSAPCREATSAVRSSITAMIGMPGQSRPSSATLSTVAKPRSVGPVAQRVSLTPAENGRRSA